MPFRVLAVPATDDGTNAEVLNAFLRTVRVVSVERQLVTQGQQTLWSFCVEYQEAGRVASPGCPPTIRMAAQRQLGWPVVPLPWEPPSA